MVFFRVIFSSVVRIFTLLVCFGANFLLDWCALLRPVTYLLYSLGGNATYFGLGSGFHKKGLRQKGRLHFLKYCEYHNIGPSPDMIGPSPDMIGPSPDMIGPLSRPEKYHPRPQTVKYITGLSKTHQSRRKFAPKCTNKPKNL